MEALLERMQKQEGGSRGFLTSCEAELQELMKQIDIMVTHKRAEWESQTQALESCLTVREQELSSLRNALDEKRKENERLCQQLQGMEKVNQDLTLEYEQQLKKVQEELTKLKRSYEKLLKRQLKGSRHSSKSQEEDQSEVSILTKKLEEFRQKSLDWEKQRLNYQQHIASLEAQRKALAEKSDLIQSQLSCRKQMFESVELASQSEIHHLTSKLERANDTICANELEVERLNMRADDLTDTNQKILEEQQRILDELKLARCSLEILHDEKMELRATLQSQEDFIKSLQVHHDQLQKEVSKLNETLCAKEALIRSLEQQLENNDGTRAICRDGAQLDHISLPVDQAEVSHLQVSPGSANAKWNQLTEELTAKCQRLQLTEEHLCQAKADIKRLKEQLSHNAQTHSSELEGMKDEVTQLTRELHQRDITIASSSGSTLGLEQQLRIEIEKAERKAVEHRAKSTPRGELQESFIQTIKKMESENQQLQKELAETKACLEASSSVCRDNYDSIVQQVQQQVTEIKNVESRKIQELQCKHEEEMRALQARFDRIVQHYEEEIQKMQNASTREAHLSSKTPALSPQPSKNNSTEFLSSDNFLRADPFPHENEEFTYVLNKSERDFLPLSPLPATNIDAIAAKFLEEEEERSDHILGRLDVHIEELKRESEKTVQQFAHPK
uniref:Centrosomal protein 63 n=1 Tax=Salvator merianae TaxID=96440 RepID=A0A8D0EA61_SALMN